MASIDFAFVAEFAKLEPAATITAINAGLRGVNVPPDLQQFQLWLAGTLSRRLGEPALTLTVTTDAPNHVYSVSQSIELDAAPADGPFFVTAFALQLGVAVAGEGKYVITVDAGGQDSTTIDLWVTTNSIPPVGGA